MKAKSYDFLRCPVCKNQLCNGVQLNLSGFDVDILSCIHCNTIFVSKDGIITFVSETDKLLLSRRMNFIRAINCAFYTPIVNLMFSFCGGVDNARHEVLDPLELTNGAKVLETGVGYGDNFLFLNHRVEELQFFGIDNQIGMLNKCKRNMKKWNIHSELYLANAEDLPFKDDFFDVVFHLGAINIFKNKKKAIDEMIRVAKPGTKILIADETQKAVNYFEFFIGKQEKVIPPVDLIPTSMEDIRLETIWNGFGYLIGFRKPSKPEFVELSETVLSGYKELKHDIYSSL